MDQQAIKVKLQEIRFTMDQLAKNLDLLFDEAFRHQTHEAPPSPPTPKKTSKKGPGPPKPVKKEIILQEHVVPRTEVSVEGITAEVLE